MHQDLTFQTSSWFIAGFLSLFFVRKWYIEWSMEASGRTLDGMSWDQDKQGTKYLVFGAIILLKRPGLQLFGL